MADISNQNSNMDIAIFKSNILLESFKSSDDFGVGSSDIKFEQAEQIEEVVEGVFGINSYIKNDGDIFYIVCGGDIMFNPLLTRWIY